MISTGAYRRRALYNCGYDISMASRCASGETGLTAAVAAPKCGHGHQQVCGQCFCSAICAHTIDTHIDSSCTPIDKVFDPSPQSQHGLVLQGLSGYNDVSPG